MMGIPQFNAKNLFVAGNFKAQSADNGLFGSIESTNNTNGVFSGTILIKTGNQNVMRFTFSLQSDTDGDFNYVTYVNLKDLLAGTVTEITWKNGDMRTAGKLTGILIEIIDMVYDKNKLFGPEYAAAQKKREQEAAEKKSREEKEALEKEAKEAENLSKRQKEALEKEAKEAEILSERQKANDLSDKFEELFDITASVDTINRQDFSLLMQLCREYLSLKYRDDGYISSDISRIEYQIERILDMLNGQQKVEYYTEFDRDKVEQAILARNKNENAEKLLNDIHSICIQLSDNTSSFSKKEFASFKQIYQDFNSFDLSSFQYYDHSVQNLYSTISEKIVMLFTRLTPKQEKNLM
jgi:hypothetical protein